MPNRIVGKGQSFDVRNVGGANATIEFAQPVGIMGSFAMEGVGGNGTNYQVAGSSAFSGIDAQCITTSNTVWGPYVKIYVSSTSDSQVQVSW